MSSDLIGMTAFSITTIIFMTTTAIYANKYHRTIKKHNAERKQQMIDGIFKSINKKSKDENN